MESTNMSSSTETTPSLNMVESTKSLDNDIMSFNTTINIKPSINDRLSKIEEDITRVGMNVMTEYPENLDIIDDSNETPIMGENTPIIEKSFYEKILEHKNKVIKWSEANQILSINIIIGLIFVVVFATLFIIKPRSVMKKYRGKKHIDWVSFMKWCILITLVIGGSVVLANKYLV